MKCPICEKEVGQTIIGHLTVTHGMNPVQMLATLFWQVDRLERLLDELAEAVKQEVGLLAKLEERVAEEEIE